MTLSRSALLINVFHYRQVTPPARPRPPHPILHKMLQLKMITLHALTSIDLYRDMCENTAWSIEARGYEV